MPFDSGTRSSDTSGSPTCVESHVTRRVWSSLRSRVETRGRGAASPASVMARPSRGWPGYRLPAGEARGLVEAERAVLEHSPSFGPVEGGPGHVVDHPERQAPDDGGVAHVDHDALGPRSSPPLTVRPVGVAAVAGPGVQADESERLDLEGERRAGPRAQLDGGPLGVAGARAVADVELGPAEQLVVAARTGAMDAHRLAEQAAARPVLLGDHHHGEIVEAQGHIRPPEAEALLGLGGGPPRRLGV